MQPKILFLDIETFPLRTYAWEVYDATAIEVDKPRIICAFSAKWLNGKQITKALPDYPGYRPGMDFKGYDMSDKHILKDIWMLLDQCDIPVAHNGRAFDLKTINTQFAKHNMPPPSPYKQVDTLMTARHEFNFPSNKLDEIGREFKVGRKMENEGKGLWFKCLSGDMKAWAKMKRYNAQDVILLESIYKRMVPWIKNHPNLGMWNGFVCPKCGSKNVVKRGSRHLTTGRYQQYQCNDCHGWSQGEKLERYQTMKNL